MGGWGGEGGLWKRGIANELIPLIRLQDAHTPCILLHFPFNDGGEVGVSGAGGWPGVRVLRGMIIL